MQLKLPPKERYKIYENGEHVGYFNVEYSPLEGRQLSADIFKHSMSFILLPDENGHVSPEDLKLWITDRIVPPTRIGIDDLLKQMGLSEYDVLGILKYTSGEHSHDTCSIDFSVKVD